MGKLSMSNMPDEVKEQLEDLKTSIIERLDALKQEADKDLEIDDIDLDRALLDTPKIHSKWLSYFTDETMNLKELYGFKEKVKFERWKYYMGKSSDKTYAKEPLHEKILKTDVDKYLSADEKLSLINDIIATQKALADYIEKVMKEIGNRGFHIKSILDFRKFSSGY